MTRQTKQKPQRIFCAPCQKTGMTTARYSLHRACRIVSAGLLCGLFTACVNDDATGDHDTDPDGKNKPSTDAGDTETDTGISSQCAPRDPDIATADAATLFDLPTVPTFDIYLPPKDWDDLEVNARDEEYVSAEACFEGKSIGEVGIRFKGSYGSLYGCFNEKDEMICRRLSIKLKFNEYDEDNRFFGLKRLNFQGNHADDTYLRERIAYDLYRQMDIVAPRASFAEIRVNDELQGLYGMVEQVDGRFTADRFPESPDGNLYKELWPVSTDDDWLLTKLRTNEEDPDLSLFKDFANAILAADEADLEETLGAYMDLDYLGRYMAVDDAIANVDGITAYYAAEDLTWAGNHNFYLYERGAKDFTLIPWDQDATLYMSIGFGNVPRWTDLPDDCEKTYPVWGGSNYVIAPGCDRLFRAMANDLTAYHEAAATLLDGPFSEKTINDTIDDHAAFIRDAVKADPHGPGLATFEGAIVGLKNEMPLLRERFSYLDSGQSWTPFLVDIDNVNDFENQDDLGLRIGTELYYNAASSVTVSVNTDDPLNGAQDLRISFVYRDSEDPWDQWMIYRVPLRDGPLDVTGMTGIRMKVRSDMTRTLRFDLNSPKATAINQGIGFGWDIEVTEDADTVEVRFDEAAIVWWAVDQGQDPGDDIDDVLSTLSGIILFPQCNGRGDDGFLPGDTEDDGFVALDDIEFF